MVASQKSHHGIYQRSFGFQTITYWSVLIWGSKCIDILELTLACVNTDVVAPVPFHASDTSSEKSRPFLVKLAVFATKSTASIERPSRWVDPYLQGFFLPPGIFARPSSSLIPPDLYLIASSSMKSHPLVAYVEIATNWHGILWKRWIICGSNSLGNPARKLQSCFIQ